MSKRVAIIVHGGAGTLIDASVPTAMNGVSIAAKTGFSKLLAGCSALDAVEAAVKVLEDSPFFNAGRGSALTKKGTAEMDALICDGKETNFGACTGLTKIKNPVSAARKVLTGTPHVFLCGEGAEAFAQSFGLEMRPQEYFITEVRKAQLQRALDEESSGVVLPSDFVTLQQAAKERIVDVGKGQMAAEIAREACKEEKVAEDCDHDTVGAVAVDLEGNVAAATSTGGLTAKLNGRIGDSPVFGSGGYADNETGCCSTTGTGEFILRAQLAKLVSDLWERLKETGETSKDRDLAASIAAKQALDRMNKKVGDPGTGLIFVAPDGGMGIAHSSPRMSHAAAYADLPAAQATSAPASMPISPSAVTIDKFNFFCGYELPVDAEASSEHYEMHVASADKFKWESRPVSELEDATVEAAKLACS
jgi:L-asparaginase / beta-aspartyl-peptidase